MRRFVLLAGVRSRGSRSRRADDGEWKLSWPARRHDLGVRRALPDDRDAYICTEEEAFDTIYVFPDCPSGASVSEAAPGHGDFNRGCWKVVQAFGITNQLTNAAAVVAAASSLVDTGVRFVCPLIEA